MGCLVRLLYYHSLRNHPHSDALEEDEAGVVVVLTVVVVAEGVVVVVVAEGVVVEEPDQAPHVLSLV